MRKEGKKEGFLLSVLAEKATINETSNLIVETMKLKRLEEIFNYLDADRDGIISAGKIDISTLPTDILEILSPLLCEMEELNLELDLETFIEAGEKLIKTLTITERDKMILGPKKQSETGESMSFTPSINRMSRMITAQKGRDSGSANQSVYDSLYRDSYVRRHPIEDPSAVSK